MNSVYLQCDCRFNKWLLEKIDDKFVIEHTILKCRSIDSSHLIAGVYNCKENEKLIDILRKYNIECILSDEDNVNRRFLNIIKKLKTNYIVRVGGDQVLIDVKKINSILREIQEDLFYEQVSGSILPDIVSYECIVKNYSQLVLEDRYFNKLMELPDVTKYKLIYPLFLPFSFRADSDQGFRVCRNVIEKKLDIYELTNRLTKQISSKNSYFINSGLMRSWVIPPESIDFYYNNEEINPWFVKAVADFIKKRLKPTFNVFEWGSGNSTIFWSRYVNRVVSVEHNREWYVKVKESIPDNIDLRLIELEYDGDYCREILNTDMKYDIVLIDGRDRVRCAKNALIKLTKGGIIIWDDTERNYYKEGFDFLIEMGFKRIELSGIKYGIPDLECFTSIFYRKENVLNI